MRRQCSGADAVEAALARGEPLRLVLLASEAPSARALAVAEKARASGVRVRDASPTSLWRLSEGEPADVLGLVGPDPEASLPEVLRAGGVLWLLCGTAYPGNTGFAIRTAEVSGADGIVVDNDFGHEGRREAVRAAMRADHFMPVFWEPALPTLEAARAAGRRLVAIEDVGARAPWETDLTGATVFVVGAERHGVPGEVLDACDEILRLPMAGFIPSYNLQAAMAMVAGERLRQLRVDLSP